MPGMPVVGMAVPLETRTPLDPGRRTVGAVRLWLKAPDGRRSVVERVETVNADLETGTVTLRAAPVFQMAGIWEWQFEATGADGAKRVLDYGRIRVKPTGFGR